MLFFSHFAIAYSSFEGLADSSRLGMAESCEKRYVNTLDKKIHKQRAYQNRKKTEKLKALVKRFKSLKNKEFH